MNIAKLSMAVLIGFILGAFVYHPISVKAAGGGLIYVKKVSEGQNLDPMATNREVVGFSCVAARPGELDACYVAAR